MAGKESHIPDKYRVVGKVTTTKGKFIGTLVKDSDRTNSVILTCGHGRTHDSKKEAETCMRDIATKQYHFTVTN